MLLKNILGELRNKLSIILVDSKNLQEVLTHLAAFLGSANPENRKTGESQIQLSILLQDSKNL
jgi:hypothetical protein